MSEAVVKAAHLWPRDPLNWYVEETFVTEALLEVERFTGAIWDPCCGQGNIVKTLREAGYPASYGMDKVCRVPHQPGWYRGEADFILDDTGLIFDNVVMNPPFFRGKGAEAFIRKALQVTAGKVAAFVELGFLAGSGRAGGLYLERPPTRTWIVTPRPSCPPGDYLVAGGVAKGGTADWCWLVWDLTAPKPAMSATGWLRGVRNRTEAAA